MEYYYDGTRFEVGKLYIIKNVRFQLPLGNNGNCANFKGDFIFLFLGQGPGDYWYKVYSPYYNTVSNFNSFWPHFEHAVELKDE